MAEMFIAATGAVIVCMLLALLRAFMGPTLYDRVLAANAFGTKTVLTIALLGFLMGRPDFVDIALLYALINFIGTIAIHTAIANHHRAWFRNSKIIYYSV